MNIIPPNHRHAAREQAFRRALGLTWNAIAPDCDGLRDRDCIGMLVDCYVEMYGGLSPEDLAAWHEMCQAKPGSRDEVLSRKLARSVL